MSGSPAGGREELLCPSAPCGPDALVIGVIGPAGRVGHLVPAPRAGPGFVRAQRALGRPEGRFRFADRCVTSGCRWWDGGRCGAGDAALELSGLAEDAERLPRCAIRPRCRWFAQNGRAACEVCSLIVTDPIPTTRSETNG